MVNIDPDTGEKHPKGEPLKTLYGYRKFDFGENPALVKERKKRVIGPPLSINCGLDSSGYVHVGDPIWACLQN